MKEKDYGNLLNAYEQLHTERPDIYVMSFDEQVERLEKLFAKDNFIRMSGDRKTAVAIAWTGSNYYCRKKMDLERILMWAQALQIC